MKILILEDDKFLVRVYAKKLEKEGYDVLYEESGENALEIAKREKPDVILTDIIMPKKDGFSVLKELKSTKETKDVPVIVLTNLSQDEDVKKYKNLGAIKFLSKSDTSFSDVVKSVKEVDKQ